MTVFLKEESTVIGRVIDSVEKSVGEEWQDQELEWQWAACLVPLGWQGYRSFI